MSIPPPPIFFVTSSNSSTTLTSFLLMAAIFCRMPRISSVPFVRMAYSIIPELPSFNLGIVNSRELVDCFQYKTRLCHLSSRIFLNIIFILADSLLKYFFTILYMHIETCDPLELPVQNRKTAHKNGQLNIIYNGIIVI